MTTVKNDIRLAFSTTLTLNEEEICALEALVGYGVEPFLKVFKANLGTSYIRDYENGVRSLFASIARDVLPAHRFVMDARSDLEEGRKARRKREIERAAAMQERVDASNEKGRS